MVKASAIPSPVPTDAGVHAPRAPMPKLVYPCLCGWRDGTQLTAKENMGYHSVGFNRGTGMSVKVLAERCASTLAGDLLSKASI